MRNKYSTEKIHIFIQGSYANNTCVRNESDVDIAVVRDDIYEYAFGERFSSSTTDNREAAAKLKDAVEKTLRKNFPYQVHRGNKSIKVNGNTYRKQADTVPCLSMHYYYRSHLKDYLTHFTLATNESKSKSLSASIDDILGEMQLTYCYLNTPKSEYRDRSEIHYGTATLSIANPQILEGQYYTDRKTNGDMLFTAENAQ